MYLSTFQYDSMNTFKKQWQNRCVNVFSGKVAQPARRVNDKRRRRAFGILDTVRWLCFVTIKGLLPTPVKQG